MAIWNMYTVGEGDAFGLFFPSCLSYKTGVFFGVIFVALAKLILAVAVARLLRREGQQFCF